MANELKQKPTNAPVTTAKPKLHRAAPDAAIAFNTRPEDSADAAARWLKAD
jgi:hypothetical protein